MSHEPNAADSLPHEPRHSSTVESEGFGSGGEGRDIFFTAVESTRMPMVVADPRLPDVPIVFVNDAFLAMTGYSRDEVVGRNCRFLQGPDTSRHAVALIRDAVRSQREITIELLNYRKDGSSFWNALFMTPIRNPAGDLIYFYSSQLDISRRKDAETALRQAQKMEALGQLTGGIAHDFNNLLQIILGNVDVAKVLTRGIDNKALAKTLENVAAAARKSGELTQQLLAFARKQRLDGRVVNLSDRADHLADLAQRTLGDTIALRRELAPDLWNVRLDPTQAEIALLHLLSNARDATPGGGSVIVRTKNVEIDEGQVSALGVPRAGRFVALSVIDEGQGIEPDILGKVMEPFFTTKIKTQGTGLGLSMVYGFAKQSGGAATISSRPGAGATVTLYFPATGEAAQAPADAPAATEGVGERVLIVDDRPEIAEMAATILSLHGYQCEQRFNARDALAEIAANPGYQLLLTDVIMPGGMNGVLLAREATLKQMGLRVVLMTGFADGTIEQHGEDGFEVLNKPFSADELLAKARIALRQT